MPKSCDNGEQMLCCLIDHTVRDGATYRFCYMIIQKEHTPMCQNTGMCYF
jgi:hypothetical protein